MSYFYSSFFGHNLGPAFILISQSGEEDSNAKSQSDPLLERFPFVTDEIEVMGKEKTQNLFWVYLTTYVLKSNV